MKTWEIKLLNKNIIKNKKNLVLSIAGKTKILFSFLIFFFLRTLILNILIGY